MSQQHVRFERLSVLGSGTRTVTEKARLAKGVSLGRVVTLVRLLPLAEADLNARERFIGKGRVLMRLEEQSAVTTLELGRARTHYLAREFIDGISMRTLLLRARERGSAPPIAFACDAVLQLCT